MLAYFSDTTQIFYILLRTRKQKIATLEAQILIPRIFERVHNKVMWTIQTEFSILMNPLCYSLVHGSKLV
jgi:hypothetical protein